MEEEIGMNNTVLYEEFVILRILGNELPPRDNKGSKLKVLRHILKHEPTDICSKFWLINHIIDPAYKTKILNVLTRYRQNFGELSFSPKNYCRLNSWEEKIRYAININNARNEGIKHCQDRFRFVICLDQDCFFTRDHLSLVIEKINNDQRVNHGRKNYGILMKRIIGENLENADQLPNEEPHLVFRDDAREYFDEKIVFGRNEKVELLSRLGYISSPEIYSIQGDKCLNVGYVLHLSYGNETVERDLKTRMDRRELSVIKLINKIENIYNAQ